MTQNLICCLHAHLAYSKLPPKKSRVAEPDSSVIENENKGGNVILFLVDGRGYHRFDFNDKYEAAKCQTGNR